MKSSEGQINCLKDLPILKNYSSFPYFFCQIEFWRTSVEPLILLCWTSGNVCLGFKARMDPFDLCASSPACNGFLIFTSGVTPTDLLTARMAAKSFWSTYLYMHFEALLGLEPGIEWTDRRAFHSWLLDAFELKHYHHCEPCPYLLTDGIYLYLKSYITWFRSGCRQGIQFQDKGINRNPLLAAAVTTPDWN